MRQVVDASISNGVFELLHLRLIQGKGDRTVGVKQPQLSANGFTSDEPSSKVEP
jgi:hypothetical protein